jgi:hypothetical protein
MALGKKHGTIMVMATIHELPAMEKSYHTHVAQYRDWGTDPLLQLYRAPKRQVDASPSTDVAWESSASLPRSSWYPRADKAQ